jgi:hypothetical protein
MKKLLCTLVLASVFTACQNKVTLDVLGVEVPRDSTAVWVRAEGYVPNQKYKRTLDIAIEPTKSISVKDISNNIHDKITLSDYDPRNFHDYAGYNVKYGALVGTVPADNIENIKNK